MISKNLEENLPSISAMLQLINNNSDRCKIPSDGFPIGSGTLTGDLGGITIWTLWSNGN
jgi:hypothetical protein